jgi:hypothetical protein
MTGLSPWKITWGKLFGPTLFQWYSGIWCLAIYFICCFAVQNTFSEILLGFLSIAIAILANALGLLFSLLSITGNQTSSYSHAKINTTLFFILAIMLAYWLQGLIVVSSIKSKETLSWYGLPWGYYVALFTLIVFAAWAIIGVQRNIRTELQYVNDSKAWYGFLFYLILFIVGFTINIPYPLYNNFNIIGGTSWDNQMREQPLSMFAILFIKLNVIFYAMTGITSFLLLIERKTPFDYKKFLTHLKSFSTQKLRYSAPLWYGSAMFTFATIFVLFILSLFGNPVKEFNEKFFGLNGFNILHQSKTSFGTWMYYVCACFLLFRDIFATRALIYGTDFKNKILVVFLYYLIIYLALPLIFGAHGNPLLALFYPYNEDGWAALSLVAIPLEALIAWFLHRMVVRDNLEFFTVESEV